MRLNEAYQTGAHVMLIFSYAGGGQFDGYAQMTSLAEGFRVRPSLLGVLCHLVGCLQGCCDAHSLAWRVDLHAASPCACSCIVPASELAPGHGAAHMQEWVHCKAIAAAAHAADGCLLK